MAKLPINIPFPFPTLRKHIPGIMRGTYYAITAASGAGKTQLTKFLAVTKAIEYAQKTGLHYRVLYFALEESKTEFYDSIRIHELVKRFKIDRDPEGQEINQYYLNGEYGPIHPEVLKKLDEIAPYVEEIKKYINVIDTVNNPTGIFKYIKNFADERGTHHYIHNKTGAVVTEPEINRSDLEEGMYMYHSYVPNDPDELVCVVIDHINILAGEKNHKDLASAMGLMSTEYLLPKVVKRFNYAAISVHQQVMSGEGLDYVKYAMLLPSQEKLGDNKMIGRDYPIIIGLFSPFKHKNALPGYPYNLELFRDNIRILNVIKHRKGKGNFEIGLFFDGRAQKFKELPPFDDPLIKSYEEAIVEDRKHGRL